MKIKNVHIVYFSATDTTRRIVKAIAATRQENTVEYDLIHHPVDKPVPLASDDLLIVGMPVYAGRIPQLAAEQLKQFRGNDTPALLAVVYGNRDYDDALLELQDLIIANGFKTVAAGAFIAQHSIFPKLATNRPDPADLTLIRQFVDRCNETIGRAADTSAFKPLPVKGNRPYKTPGVIPLHPRTAKSCNCCGNCARQCPTGAIPPENPRKTAKEKCISCGHCIAICPRHARRFGGVLHWMVGRKFVKKFSARKEAELFFQP